MATHASNQSHIMKDPHLNIATHTYAHVPIAKKKKIKYRDIRSKLRRPCFLHIGLKITDTP